MGLRGPAKIPRAFKIIAGTDKPERRDPGDTGQPLVDAMKTAPEPPAWMTNTDAIDEWHRLAKILVANGLLTEMSVSGLATLCALYGQLIAFWSGGRVPPPQLLSQYRAMINDFGLTPVARGRVKPVGQEKDTRANPFARNGRRA